jgi:hypothetical protein
LEDKMEKYIERVEREQERKRTRLKEEKKEKEETRLYAVPARNSRPCCRK